MQFALNGIDIGIIVLSLLVTVVVGLLASRGEDKTAKGYFLASGRMPWYIIGTAYVSTSVSSEQIVGTIGQAYKHGMGVGNWEWFTVPHYAFLMLVFVPMYLSNRIATIPEFLSRRYGSLCGDIYSWVMVIGYVFIFMVPVLYGGSLTFANLTGWSFYAVLWGMVLLIAIYALKGGLASVMWTDAVQCVMLIGGGLLLFFTALAATPGGWGAMIAADPQRFHLYHPPNDEIAPFLGMLTFVFTGGLFYGAGNQVMLQRILGARSRWDGMMGVVFAGFVNFLRPLVTCFLGFVVYYWVVRLGTAPRITNVDSAFPFAVAHIAPDWGLRGIVLAGFLAAVMSTVSALGNSTATIFSLDVYQKLLRPKAAQKELVWVGRAASLAAMTLAAIVAPRLQGTTIFEYFQQGVSYLATPFSAVILLGVLWKRTNYPGALFGLIGGIIIQLAIALPEWTLHLGPLTLHGMGLAHLPAVHRAAEALGLVKPGLPIHWFYNSFVAEAITIVGVVIVSLLTAPPPEERWKPFLWKRTMLNTYEEGFKRPWWHNWVLWFGVYAIIWCCIYAYFW